jgi:hypothetical protein
MATDHIVAKITFDTIVGSCSFQIRVTQVQTFFFEPWLSTKQPADVTDRDMA